jgi:hypothetical protein
VAHADKPASNAAVAAPAPQPTAAALDTASTPFLIMQQQQRDSALSKRQHSGVMGSFFAVSVPCKVESFPAPSNVPFRCGEITKPLFLLLTMSLCYYVIDRNRRWHR